MTLIGILFFKLVSAQIDFQLSDLLENEILRFVLVFLFFFAIIFYAMNKFFRGAHKDRRNKGVSIVVAMIFSFFISSFIFKGDYFSFSFDIFNDNILLYAFVLLIFIFVLWKFGVFKKKD